MPAQVWISPLAFIIACPLIAVLILWAVRRTVRKANRKIQTARTQVARSQVRAETAERAHEWTATLAAEAHAQTSQALHVARKINAVDEKMDLLLGAIGDELLGQSHGRHALPDERNSLT